MSMHRVKNTQTLLFRVEEAGTDIVLRDEGVEFDRVRVEPNRELLEKILPAIDGMLAKHAVVPGDIADIRVETDLPDGYSSRRIAETVAEVWRWGRNSGMRNESHV